MVKKLNPAIASTILTIIVILIILWTIIGDTSSDVGTSADGLSVYNSSGDVITNTSLSGSINDASTTLPLTSLFKKKGVVLLAFMAGIVLVLVGVFLSAKK